MKEKKKQVESENKNEQIPPIENVPTEPAIEVKKDFVEMPFVERIENARIELQTKYKKNKRLGTIITLVVVALVVLAFVLMYQEADGFKFAGYGVAGATLVGMIIYYIINRNRFPDSTREYINFVSVQFNGFVFENNAYEKLTMDPKDKLDAGEISADKIYSDVTRIGSRNIVQGIYLKEHFTVADVAAYIRKDKKQEAACFVGKYISFPNKLIFDGRIIINSRSEKEIDVPTDTADLQKVKELDRLTVYASEGLEYEKILGPDFISEIEQFKVEKNLMNLNVVIWGGHTAIYLSYSDELMTIPFENPYNEEPIRQYRDEQLMILKIIALLNK